MPVRAVYAVFVPGREEGLHLFEDLHDAEDFAWAVRDHGEVAELSEELLYPYLGAGELIDSERRSSRSRRSVGP